MRDLPRISSESSMDTPTRPPIQGIGEILSICDNGLFLTRMKNGYEVMTHLDRNLKKNPINLSVGNHILVEFSPYDMSQGRILGLSSEE